MAPHGLGRRAQEAGRVGVQPVAGKDRIEDRAGEADAVPAQVGDGLLDAGGEGLGYVLAASTRRGAGTVRTWTPSGTPGPKAGVISATAVEWP